MYGQRWGQSKINDGTRTASAAVEVDLNQKGQKQLDESEQIHSLCNFLSRFKSRANLTNTLGSLFKTLGIVLL